MVDRHCEGRLHLFPSTKVSNIFEKKYSINNNDIVPFLHVFNWKSNKYKYFYKPWRPNGFLFEIIINVLVSSFRFI